MAFANAVAYALAVASPVIQSDGWFFLDSFLRRDLSHEVSWTDFFVKRSTTDHSQPVNKLLLLLHARLLDLDFSAETWFGLLGMLLYAGLSVGIVGRGSPRPVAARPPSAVIALIPILAFSLNSTMVYSWPLVSFFYAVLPFALVLFLTVFPDGGCASPGFVFVSALACVVALDDAGLLACASAVATLALHSRVTRRRRPFAIVTAVIGLACVVYRVSHGLMAPAGVTTESLAGLALHALGSQLDQSWKWVIIPAASSVVHPSHLTSLPGGASAPMIVLGLFVVVAHAAFWRSALGTLGERPTFYAVALMLFSYGLTAGIVIGRVPVFGSDYLYQHRYVALYQLANVALVVQLCTVLSGPASTAGPVIPRAENNRPLGALHISRPVALFVVVSAVQAGLSISAWREAKHIRSYTEHLAASIHCLAAHPELERPLCPALLVVCSQPREQRNELVGLLKAHALNVFSPAFQARHGLYPSPAKADVCVPQTTP